MVPGRMPDKGMVEDLTKEFLAESQEGLERMELCLTELERRPGDGELLSEIFRTVHTIKRNDKLPRVQPPADAGPHRRRSAGRAARWEDRGDP